MDASKLSIWDNDPRLQADALALTEALKHLDSVDSGLPDDQIAKILHLQDVLNLHPRVNPLHEDFRSRCQRVCDPKATNAHPFELKIGKFDPKAATPLTVDTRAGSGEGETAAYFKFPEDQGWTLLKSATLTAEDEAKRDPSGKIAMLNKMSFDKRDGVQFRFVVTLSNIAKNPKNWQWMLWAETLAHEMCIHVETVLNLIERYRDKSLAESVTWDTLFGNDHFFFQHRGSPRYSLWLFRLAEASADIETLNYIWDKNGKDTGPKGDAVQRWAFAYSSKVGPYIGKVFILKEKRATSTIPVDSLRACINDLAPKVWQGMQLHTQTGDPKTVDPEQSRSLIDAINGALETFLQAENVGHDPRPISLKPVGKNPEHFWWWPAPRKLYEFDYYVMRTENT